MTTTILLVRHGKASNDHDDYDWLSTVGEQQMTLVGESFVRGGIRPERVWHGTHRRHRASVDILRRIWEQADCRVQAEAMSELDEFDMRAMRSILTSMRDTGGPDRFLEAVDAWAKGRLEGYGESFDQFLARSREAVEHIAGSGPGTRLVVTSGGVVAAVVAAAGPDPRGAFADLLGRTQTASVTEIIHHRGESRVVRYGDTSHLPESLRTLV